MNPKDQQNQVPNDGVDAEANDTPDTSAVTPPEEVVEPPSREELWEICEGLATDSNILARVEGAVREAGFAGPTTALKLVYLAIVTRMFDRPVSVALRGPSSAGKSFTLKQAASLHPPEACVTLTSMSDKALIYLDEDLRHRMLVIQEAAGVNGGTFAYALRSLLSEGSIEYVYTDFDARKTRRISKDGPTGLLTSTAGAIDFELATRLVTPNVADSPELTRSIMLAEGRTEEGAARHTDHSSFHALQRYIAAGSTGVVVPFAQDLAKAINPTAVRMRRDFPSLLGLIKAHALIHQVGRDRDDSDRVLAERADYAVVYELVAEMIAEGAELVVPKVVRETVDAVDELSYSAAGGTNLVTMVGLAKHLGISRSATSRRVKRAAGMGFLRDVNPDKDGAKILETAETMPGDVEVLPDPEDIG